jgi:hypothetical protein
MSEKHVNTFTNGMSQDQDPQLQQSTTYKNALNGRIVFNENGTLAFQNAKGNVFAVNLTEGYMPIATEEANGGKYCIIFSTNGTNSEIGFLVENTASDIKYQVAFNDANDPDGNKLNFSKRHQIKSSTNYENDELITAYFDDDLNEPRAFNIMAGKAFGWITPYPSWYSVASMASMIDFIPDMPQYNRTIIGTLQSGRYQYCYRLIHENGYKTPYTTPCGLITVSSDSVNAVDWTKYQMGASGANSSKGLEIVIENVDRRYKEIEVVAIHWLNDTTPSSAYIFTKTNITTSVNPFVSMTFQHLNINGQYILVSDINQEFVDIARAKTNTIYRDSLHRGNVVLKEKIEAITDNVEIYPLLRNVLSDTKGSTTSLPFTNQAPSNSYLGYSDDCFPIKYVNASGGIVNNIGLMDNEYYNYKGTQIENRVTGYFRGETYPFAIVLYDMKGQPMFAKHIADISMPKQYSDETDTDTKTYFKRINGTTHTDRFIDAWDGIVSGTLTPVATSNETFKPTQTGAFHVSRNRSSNGNEGLLRPLGLLFNNIDLTDFINDASGKQVVSAFSIVRMPRYENIAFQGITYTKDSNNHEYLSEFSNASNNIAIIHSPDKEFDSAAEITNNENCRIHILGGVYNDSWDSDDYIGTTAYGHHLTKNYQSTRIYQNPSGGSILDMAGAASYSNTYWRLGDVRTVTSPPIVSGILGVDVYNGSEQNMIAQYSVIASSDLPTTGIVAGAVYTAAPIVNYELGISSPTITTTELQGRIYKNIGHMIPLTPSIIADNTDGSGKVIFNGVEVFGGDCYLSMVDYCRLVPYENTLTDPNSARIVVFPCESKYNCDLRYGNQSAKVATRDTSANTTFPDGILIKSGAFSDLEEWDLNSVLLAQDNWRLFFPRPSFPAIDNQPTLHYYSNKKVVNESQDNYRIFAPLNYNNVDGKYGEITRMDLLFNEMYLFQSSGFCRARFEERALVATTLGDLSTGTGIGLQGYDYVNKEFGLQQQFAFCKSGKAFYWVDAYKGKFIKFSQAGIETPNDIAGFHTYFNSKLKDYWGIPPKYKIGSTIYDVAQYSPIEEYNYIDNSCGIDKIIASDSQQSGVGGINLCYDYKNDSVIIAFSDVIYGLESSGNFVLSTIISQKETIEYSEILNKFTSYHGFYPNIIFPFKQRVITNFSTMNGGNTIEKLYIHDEGIRGELYNSDVLTTLEFIASPHLGLTKYFDNGRLNVNESGISLLSNIEASTQNLAAQNIVLNNSIIDNRPKYLEGLLRYPIMAKGQNQRLRDKDLILKITITNDGSDKLVNITSHETIWRLSYKI